MYFALSDSNRSLLKGVLMSNTADMMSKLSANYQLYLLTQISSLYLALLPIHSASILSHRRASLAVQPTTSVSSVAPHGVADPATLKESNASAFYHSSSNSSSPFASNNSPGIGGLTKSRKRAVIIVDARSTEVGFIYEFNCNDR